MRGSIVVLLATATVAGAVGSQVALQAASTSAETQVRVDLNLADGSRVSGSVEGARITLVLPYGRLVLPLADVTRLDRHEGGVLASLRSGDKVRGRTESPAALDIRTPYGTLSVPVSEIVRLRRTERPTAPAAGPTSKPAAARPTGRSQTVARVASLPGAQYVDAIKVLANRPNEIVMCTQNVGARCGGGTPATIWKLLVDPATGASRSLAKKQILKQIQQVRGTIFQASDGTLFTGGGWCGYRPPYYSTDNGETWQPATKGTHPPNSTFSFAEFKGRVYAGTGYEPHHAQVYRWKGDGSWERVLDVAPPRSILHSMTVYDGRLFAAPEIYWHAAKQADAPVYLSADGETFKPAEGIPDTHNVFTLLSDDSGLYAFTYNKASRAPREVYRWDEEQWILHGQFPSNLHAHPKPIAGADATWYATGKVGDTKTHAVYASRDAGKSWFTIANVGRYQPMAIDVHGNLLYVGTTADEDHVAYVYRIDTSSLVLAAARPADTRAELIANSVGITLVAVPPGEGIDPFFIGETEVTQAQYVKVMDKNPSGFKGPNLPAERVTWQEAVDFCKALTTLERKKGLLRETEEYRLPTPDEWEYACRAGSRAAYCYGDDVERLGDHAWYKANASDRTHPVATKKPNAWGLYDMHGNVWEWCSDWPSGSSEGKQVDAKDPASGATRVVRGGCWCETADWLRSGRRHKYNAAGASSQVGFRCVRTIASHRDVSPATTGRAGRFSGEG